jgi:hypothetical protein
MSDSPNRILGRGTVTVDGTRIAVKPGIEVDALSGERQEEMGEYAPEGFTEKAKAAMLKFEAYVKPGVTQSSLYKFMDVTVVFVGDNGYTCTFVAATTKKVGPPKTGSGGATMAVEMFAMTANEGQS